MGPGFGFGEGSGDGEGLGEGDGDGDGDGLGVGDVGVVLPHPAKRTHASTTAVSLIALNSCSHVVS